MEELKQRILRDGSARAPSTILSGSSTLTSGKGVVVDEDPETGTVRVKFESFGERRISAASLQEDDG